MDQERVSPTSLEQLYDFLDKKYAADLADLHIQNDRIEANMKQLFEHLHLDFHNY